MGNSWKYACKDSYLERGYTIRLAFDPQPRLDCSAFEDISLNLDCRAEIVSWQRHGGHGIVKRITKLSRPKLQMEFSKRGQKSAWSILIMSCGHKTLQDGTLRKPQYIITSQDVQLHASALFQKHLRLMDHGPRGSPSGLAGHPIFNTQSLSKCRLRWQTRNWKIWLEWVLLLGFSKGLQSLMLT